MEEKKDYKKLYLETRHQALMLEMNMMQMRAMAIEKELPEIEEQLKVYDSKSEESNTNKA